jgi:hypothetical protein
MINVSVVPIPLQVDQVKAIQSSEQVFDALIEAVTLRLYRVDENSGEIVHVQTWTRDADVAERV